MADTRSTDRGMTLIELLVSIAVMGAIATVLSAAITVTFRQQADTAGSVDVARWEQTLALYLPPDLASADPLLISDDPTAVPTVSGGDCALPECTFGSNALLIGWDDGSGFTSVSYRYGPSDTGDGFMLTRVECHDGSCRSRVILRDLAPPTDPTWAPGDPVPDTVIDVAAPSVSGEYSSTTITVSVNGLPTVDGVPRSSTVRVSAGGVTQPPLSTPAFEGPEFIQASSGCGGPVTLIVDESGSIGSSGEVSVREGVESFVRAFEGTPTQLQVITMNGATDVLDAAGSTAWNRFFDLSESADVNELVGDASPGTGGYLSQIDAGGQTNWEEALYRAFYHDSGVTYEALGNPALPPPELVVFFTDGVPTRPNGADSSFGDYDVPDVDFFSARAWYRANEIAKQFRNKPEVRIIGVGVGDAFSTNPSQNSRNTSSLPDPWPNSVKNVILLGDLIAGNSNPAAGDGMTELFEIEQSTDGTWGDLSTTHVLGTSDMNNLGGALAAIALDSCGGTLTVQTRDGAGNPADVDVTYTLGVEQATTSRIRKAVTFDVPLSGSPSGVVELRPEPLAGSGYVATGWNCRAGGADLVQGVDYTLVGAPGDGIDVTVTTNTAVSCTMQVATT